MRTLRRIALLTVPFLGFGIGSTLAQRSNPLSGPGAPSTPSPEASVAEAAPEAQAPDQAAPGATNSPAGPACWQQAGIPKKAMRARQSILANAKTQIQNVNDDTSLTPLQQRRQIRQIRQNAMLQAAKFVTPEQETALRQCQRERKQNAAPQNSPEASPPGTQPN